jgi:hypothetical protein
MAYHRTPVQNMCKAGGHQWMFFAVIDKANVIDHLYLRDASKAWWLIDREMPFVTSRCGSPFTKYPDGVLAISGPVQSFPSELTPVDGKPALAEAMAGCLRLSSPQVPLVFSAHYDR